MAYKFGPDEPLSSAIARVGREQLDRAVAELSERINEDPVSAVHNARKALKKERSLLRLARGAMPAKQRRSENAVLRQAGRRLSGARDAAVMTATIDALADRFSGQLPSKTFTAIRKQLERASAREEAARGASPLADHAVGDLGAMRVRVDDWRLSSDKWKAIDPGLARSYQRGRKAFARARDSESFEDLHAWRKRVKDLWYHLRLLTPTCGPTVGGQAKEAHRLADLLGDDHDLGLLRAKLAHETIPVGVDVDAVVKLIDFRRDELQTEAFRLGGRVYAETPKAFRRRLRRSWKAGRGVAHAPKERHPAELAAATRQPGPA